jgi:hypothetical protein
VEIERLTCSGISRNGWGSGRSNPAEHASRSAFRGKYEKWLKNTRKEEKRLKET